MTSRLAIAFILLLPAALTAYADNIPIGKFVNESNNQPIEFTADQKVIIGIPGEPGFMTGDVRFYEKREAGGIPQEIDIMVFDEPAQFCEVLFTPIGGRKVAMGLTPRNPPTCPQTGLLSPAD